jgi:hypothetical protein
MIMIGVEKLYRLTFMEIKVQLTIDAATPNEASKGARECKNSTCHTFHSQAQQCVMQLLSALDWQSSPLPFEFEFPGTSKSSRRSHATDTFKIAATKEEISENQLKAALAVE